MSSKADALRHIEAAENILRDVQLLEIPAILVDEDPQVLRKKARLFVEKLSRQVPETFLVALDRALFESTIQGEHPR